MVVVVGHSIKLRETFLKSFYIASKGLYEQKSVGNVLGDKCSFVFISLVDL